MQSSVKDKFVRLLTAAAYDFGDFSNAAVTKAAAYKAKTIVDAAIANGAKFLYGDSKMRGPASLAPSILINVDKKSTISTGEAFAPTAFVTSIEIEEEAIEEANSRIGGLSASVFTGSWQRGLCIAGELEFGGVQLNAMTLFVQRKSTAPKCLHPDLLITSSTQRPRQSKVSKVCGIFYSTYI